MKATAIIPARFGAERLPGKPLIELAGRPMISHVCERVAGASSVSRVIVATDDDRIREVVESNGCQVVMTDPDLPSGSDRIAAAIRELDIDGPIVNVQGDEPMIDPEVIDRTVAAFNEVGPDCATPVAPVSTLASLSDPSTPKVVFRADGTAIYFSRWPIPYDRAFNPEEWLEQRTYYRHVGLYVYNPETLKRFVDHGPIESERSEGLEQLRMIELGMRIHCVKVSYDGRAVDTAEDVMHVEAALG